jgi:hypothetical protein
MRLPLLHRISGLGFQSYDGVTGSNPPTDEGSKTDRLRIYSSSVGEVGLLRIKSVNRVFALTLTLEAPLLASFMGLRWRIRFVFIVPVEIRQAFGSTYAYYGSQRSKRGKNCGESVPVHGCLELVRRGVRLLK